MRSLSRRELLRCLGIGSAGLALAACQPKVVEVEKIVKETVVLKEVVKETVMVAGTPQVVEKTVEKVVTATPAPKAVEKVTLRFAPWPGAPSREPIKAVVKAFNESQDRITVKEEEMGGEGSHYQKLLVRAAAGVLPDLAFMQGSHEYVSFITSRLLLPIDDMIAADATFVREERLPKRAEPIFVVLGRTWGLPNEAASFGMYYNKTLFDKAGVPYPKADWTWEDFLEKAIALTKGEGNTKQFGFIQGFDPFRTEVFVRTNGARMFASDEFPRTINLTSPGLVEAIQFLHDLRWKYKAAPVESQAQAQAGGVSFDTGRIAMVMDGNWMAPTWAPKLKQLGMEWDAAPIPKKKVNTTWLSVDITPIFAGTKYPQECYEFIKFWNKEGQPYMLDLWGRMPVIPNAATKALFQAWVTKNGGGPLATDSFWSAWDNGWIQPMTPAWAELNAEVLTPAWEEMFLMEGTSVAQVLQKIQPAAQKILTEKGQPA